MYSWISIYFLLCYYGKTDENVIYNFVYDEHRCFQREKETVQKETTLTMNPMDSPKCALLNGFNSDQ